MNSDGLPTWVVQALSDTQLMSELKADVFAHLNNFGLCDADEVISNIGASRVFEQPVEDFIGDWKKGQ